ncbi:flagellar basal body P-ring formation chaperone FlgA [Oceaniglobus ichthyenteri]|uniref:flagellar basal body P-ring formation chaperone FlgA n=1 Tax=Oceaniglobus ichthyenteri TaxID=2136177 RepID=UPI000D3450C7|nr:flagellar basal body P-ring formation chaperone FlgA [Oceaniglobus ichthyenteri]
MIRALITCLIVAPGATFADSVVAARTIRSQAILGPADLTMVTADLPGTFSNPDDVIGMEARVVLYAGRPIRASDIGPPALVERNQIVMVYYRAGPLNIVMEGRTLARAGVGDRLRVMNLESRNTVTGIVSQDGSIIVTNTLP